MSQPERRLPALDTLRAIAILWVIAFHFPNFGVGARTGLAPLFTFGSAGVDLFFVLSGYLITGIILRQLRSRGALPLREFWWRRWMRTLPAYYVTLAIIGLSGRIAEQGRPWVGFPTYLVFAQNYLSALPRFAWSWSLCVEEQFYLALPLAVLAVRRIWRRATPEAQLRAIAVIAFAVSVAARWWWWRQASATGERPLFHETFGYYETHLRLDGLAAGVFVATLPRVRPGPRLTGAAAIAGAVVALLVFGQLGAAWRSEQLAPLSLAFALFVYASAGPGRWADLRVPGAEAIADLSYSLYLTHFVVIRTVDRLLHGRVPDVVEVALLWLLMLGAAVALRRAVEIPFLRIRDRRAPAPVAAAAR